VAAFGFAVCGLLALGCTGLFAGPLELAGLAGFGLLVAGFGFGLAPLLADERAGLLPDFRAFLSAASSATTSEISVSMAISVSASASAEKPMVKSTICGNR
jgi:hypothetical protein